MKYLWMTIIWASMLWLVSCGGAPVQLFNANFDSDSAGGLPSLDPPGSPVGDSIWIATVDVPSVSATHAVSVIREGAISGNSLSYSNIDIPSLEREVRFYSREIIDRKPRYWASWVGRLDYVSETTSPLQIHFGNFTIGYAAIQIHASKLWVNNPSISNEWEVVGEFIPEEEHSVFTWIDDVEGTFFFTIISKRGPILNIGPKPLTSRSILSEQRLDLQLRFDGDSHSEARYVIDSILILAEEPEMP